MPQCPTGTALLRNIPRLNSLSEFQPNEASQLLRSRRRPTRPGLALLLLLCALMQTLWTQLTECAEEWSTPKVRGIKAVSNHPIMSPPWHLDGLPVPTVRFVKNLKPPCWWWRTWCQIPPPHWLTWTFRAGRRATQQLLQRLSIIWRLVKLIQGYKRLAAA